MSLLPSLSVLAFSELVSAASAKSVFEESDAEAELSEPASLTDAVEVDPLFDVVVFVPVPDAQAENDIMAAHRVAIKILPLIPSIFFFISFSIPTDYSNGLSVK